MTTLRTLPPARPLSNPTPETWKVHPLLFDRLRDDVLRIVRRATRKSEVVRLDDIVRRLVDWSENDFPIGLRKAVSNALRYHCRRQVMEYKRRTKLGWRTWW